MCCESDSYIYPVSSVPEMAQCVGCSACTGWAYNGKCHRREAVTHKSLLFLCFVHGPGGVLTHTFLVKVHCSLSSFWKVASEDGGNRKSHRYWSDIKHGLTTGTDTRNKNNTVNLHGCCRSTFLFCWPRWRTYVLVNVRQVAITGKQQ